MEGGYQEGWYVHPSLGLIKVTHTNRQWVYLWYTEGGAKALSMERPVDPWTWALSEAKEIAS